MNGQTAGSKGPSHGSAPDGVAQLCPSQQLQCCRQDPQFPQQKTIILLANRHLLEENTRSTSSLSPLREVPMTVILHREPVPVLAAKTIEFLVQVPPRCDHMHQVSHTVAFLTTLNC